MLMTSALTATSAAKRHLQTLSVTTMAVILSSTSSRNQMRSAHFAKKLSLAAQWKRSAATANKLHKHFFDSALPGLALRAF